MARNERLAFAPPASVVADFIQISLGRDVEYLAGSIVDPDCSPYSADDLFDPSWVRRELVTDALVLAGPVYLRDRTAGGIVHMKSFLACRTRIEAEQRMARRTELENRQPRVRAGQRT
ncbi:hypothetical protein [Mesorhizobium comanense]|jgi:hypothetical protein|uniref:hypothetical protein n=1 Tax=Mesorhizobium comanense TaxID=2502215 RepID=UPI001E38C0FC|nr:hypothetical protein [Mesorhizobium comanense]